MRISASMIVRDEERHLPGCLESIRDLVDEIVVVDTGSTDRTPEIARDFGARVAHVPWTGDFAAARNESIAHCRGAWILYIDADERVRPADRAELQRLLDDRSVVTYTVLFRPKTGYTRYREHRIFRNDSRIRFGSVIHETVMPALRTVRASDGLRFAPSPIAIDHVGYDGDQSHKHARDLSLLRIRLADNPDHIYSWVHLGRTLAATGDVEGARAAWRRCLEIVRQRTTRRTLDSLPYVDLLRHLPQDGAEFAAVLEEALALFPDEHSLAWIEGRVLMAQARFREAISRFERLAAIDPETFCDEFVSYDGRVFGVQAWESLAVCHFRLGDVEASARYYARAVEAAPHELAYRVKLDFMESRARARR